MRKIKKYIFIAKISFQENLAYTLNFFVDTFFFVFIIFVFLKLWETIYQGQEQIAGYTLNQLIWYCIMTEMIAHTIGNVFGRLSNDIKGGGIAYIINKPYNYVLYQLSNSAGQMSIKLCMNAVIGLLIGMLYIGPLQGFNLRYLPFMILSIITGILLNFFLYACIGLTAFWAEENTAYFWIVQKLVFMLGMFIPVEFLPEWLQKVVLFLPFPYVNYGPAKLVVDFSLERFTDIFSVQVTYLVALAGLSFFIFGRGVKKLNVNGG